MPSEKRQKQGDKTKEKTALYYNNYSEHGRAGIGVVSLDATIYISEEIPATTNNAAECLAVIRGLEECLRRAYRPSCVYTDSQLAVYWTSGRYAARSNTARKYTPAIRTLLQQAGTTLHWISGTKNLADKPSREAIGVWRDPNLSPMQVVCSTPLDKLRFRDFARLKSGRDQYSKLRLPALAALVDPEARKLAEAEFGRDRERAKCLRWVLRGLPVAAAVCKVKVDLEITDRAIEKRLEVYEDEDLRLEMADVFEDENDNTDDKSSEEEQIVSGYTLVRRGTSVLICDMAGELLATKDVTGGRHWQNFVAKFGRDAAYRSTYTGEKQ
jgi:ribonuclease HI